MGRTHICVVVLALVLSACSSTKHSEYRFPPGQQGLLANNDWEASEALAAVGQWCAYGTDRTWGHSWGNDVRGRGAISQWISIVPNAPAEQRAAIGERIIVTLMERMTKAGADARRSTPRSSPWMTTISYESTSPRHGRVHGEVGVWAVEDGGKALILLTLIETQFH